MNELEQAMRHPDVIKNQIKQNGGRKTVAPYSPSNPPPYPVTSVNGQTGDVDVPTVDLPVSVQDGGTGATTAAQAAKNLGVLPLGEVATKIPSGADLNDYGLPGVYAIGGNSTAATIANIPQQSAGTLRVFSSNGGNISASSTWKYLIQEYITYRGARYQRYGESGSGTAVTWGAWKTIYTSADISVPVSVSQGGTGADNAADARENLGLVRTLLWTNPTPSTLAAGTQNFSMSGYSQVEIECTRTGSTSDTYFVRSGIGTSSSPVTVDLTTIRLETGNSNLNSITLMTRTADVYSTGIVFSSGQMIYNGGLYKDWDSRAVPYRVWGIR